MKCQICKAEMPIVMKVDSKGDYINTNSNVVICELCEEEMDSFLNEEFSSEVRMTF